MNEIRFEKVVVDAEQARKWLEGQVPNRPLRSSRVAAYAADMRNGKWQPTPQGLLFDADGRLIDGQHRLQAVILSGTSQEMWVAWDVPDHYGRYLDQGIMRRPKDVLQMEDGLVSVNILQAAARLVLLYERRPSAVWSAHTTSSATDQDIIDEVRSHKDAYAEAASHGQRLNRAVRSGGHLTTSVHAAMYVLVDRYSGSPEMWDEWHTGIVTGANLSPSDPRLALRNSRRAQKFGGSQHAVMACIRAWNAYVEGEDLFVIRVSPRYLPMAKIS